MLQYSAIGLPDELDSARIAVRGQAPSAIEPLEECGDVLVRRPTDRSGQLGEAGLAPVIGQMGPEDVIEDAVVRLPDPVRVSRTQGLPAPERARQVDLVAGVRAEP